MRCYARNFETVLRRPVEPGLRAAVTVMNQALLGLGCALVEGLFQRIQSKVATKGVGYTPAHDAAGKRIDDEGHVDKAAPGRHVGQIGHPQRVGALHHEVALDPISGNPGAVQAWIRLNRRFWRALRWWARAGFPLVRVVERGASEGPAERIAARGR